MAITRTIFKNAFQTSNIPDWTCPTCHKGALITDSKNVKTYESAFSLSVHGHDEWDPEWMRGVFLGLLKCSNASCNETVVITGIFHSVENHEYDQVNNSVDMVINQMLTPTCFNPPLHIFHINKDLPANIRNEIINSFNVYWLDISSCANKIRVVVELIMDDMKIPKTYLSGNKRRGYILHKRIELFKVEKPEQADLLMAIKWIGNSGSHTSDSLTKDDILDSYEILEHVTTKLYETDSKRIAKLTKTINKRKKPIGNTKARKTK
jgi:hypothetical protein